MNKDDALLLLKLYELQQTDRIFGGWDFSLHTFKAENYEDFVRKYPPGGKEFESFYSVGHFLEVSGVLIKNKLLPEDLFFDTFYFEPIWRNFEPVVKDLRKMFNEEGIMENFQFLYNLYLQWKENRSAEKYGNK